MTEEEARAMPEETSTVSVPNTADLPWMRATLRVAQFIAPLILGSVIGAVGVILLLQQQAKAFAWIATAAATAIVFCLVGFVLTRAIQVFLRSKLMLTDSSSWGRFVAPLMVRLYPDAATAAQVSEAVTTRGPLIVQAMMAGAASAYAIGLAISMTAGLVALGQTVASYQQVERLDRQNVLLEKQNVLLDAQTNLSRRQLDQEREGQSTTYYLTQLDQLITLLERNRQTEELALLPALNKELKSSEASIADIVTVLRDRQFGKLDGGLRARLGALASSIQGYQRYPGIAENFSPQRGHLLSVLVEHGVHDMRGIDLAGADAGNLVLHDPGAFQDAVQPLRVHRALDLWTTQGTQSSSYVNLHHANLSNATLGNVFLGKADLRNAFLPPVAQLGLGDDAGPMPLSAAPVGRTATYRLLFSGRNSPSFLAALEDDPHVGGLGANLEGAVIPTPDWLEQARQKLGPQRINFSLWKPRHDGKHWRLTLDETSSRMQAVLRDSYRLSYLEGWDCPEDLAAQRYSALEQLAEISRGQILDRWRPFSREQGVLILAVTEAKAVQCLRRLNVNVSHAFLGFTAPGVDLDLSGMDLRKVSFEGGEYRNLVLTGAQLPPAVNFMNLTVHGNLQVEGARIPNATWRAEVERIILFRDDQQRQLIRCGRQPNSHCDALRNATLIPPE